jgi:hypothetical protein
VAPQIDDGVHCQEARRATSPMLNLRWSNLEVRLRMIDEAALQTESQKRTYQAVEDLVGKATPRSAPRPSIGTMCTRPNG